MTSSAHEYDDFDQRPPIIPFRAYQHDGPDPGEVVTLRRFYEECILPVIAHEESKNSLKEDRGALKHWERHTLNPDIRLIGREDIIKLRDGLLCYRYRGKLLAPATINKVWRELHPMLSWAQQDGWISRVPVLAPNMKMRLVKEPPKQQHEIVDEHEVELLWRACSKATYPSGGCLPAPQLYRVILVLFWIYGPRTEDLLGLTWDDISFKRRLLSFTAHKTHKLQGLPLTDLVIAHLQSIQGRSHRVFPGLVKPGFKDHKKNKIERGYYSTWNYEIRAAAQAAGLTWDVQWHHFRESMIERHEERSPGLGSWIAAHSAQGVTNKNYRLPTRQIREAIEATPVPACFHEIERRRAGCFSRRETGGGRLEAPR